MVLPTGRVWLGVMALSGLLFTVSIPEAYSTPYQVSSNQIPVFEQLQASLNKFPSGTYSQVVHNQLNWSNIVNVPATNQSLVDTDAEKKLVKVVADVAKQATKSSNKQVSKSVQTALASSTNISRGSTDNSILIEHALSLQGTRYIFGGTGRNGFDCSGFTQYVFAGSEKALPRTSFEQFTRGTSVNRDQLQSGDLVFFQTYAAGASHVGIYIGGGRFVHASIKGVKVSSLNEGYYNSHYLGARRIR